jgi:hypothetical protein
MDYGGGGQRVKFNNGNITTNDNYYIFTYFSSGNSNICDTNGNLILASDGYNIYDSTGNYIDGGDTLVPKYHYEQKNGWSLYSQSSIFLPMDSDKYYFVTPAFSDAQYLDCQQNNHCFFDLLLYNVIDMKANGGAGKVTQRMIPLMQNAELSKTQMMACRHANGKDWWLLKQGGDSNIVYKFLFTQDSVIDKGRQVFNDPVWGVWDLEGQSVFNDTGDRYASTVKSLDVPPGKISILNFDRCYGKLDNLKVITAPPTIFPPDTTKIDQSTNGLAFSPNGRFLYATMHYNVYQYDLQDDTWFQVAGMDTIYQKFNIYSTLYKAPDGKLYVGRHDGLSKRWSTIDNPDVKGAGCNFCPNCFRIDSLGANAYLGTPPCMPNYSLGAKVCDPEGVEDVVKDESELVVYPNPTSTILYITSLRGTKQSNYQIASQSLAKTSKALYNSVGQMVLSTKENEIDVSNLPRGVYFLKVGNMVRKVIVE